MKNICIIQEKVVSLQYNLKQTDMTKEFKDVHFGTIIDAYKVSVNYREKTIRVWCLDRRKQTYLKHLKASSLTIQEIDEVMFDMTFYDFKQFLKTDIFYLWK